MKIFFVLHGFPPQTSGGSERAVEALARAMQHGGHDVSIIAGSLDVGAPSEVTEEDYRGLRVLRLHRDDLFFESWWKTYHPGVSAAFRDLLSRERPDVVHVHHWIRLTSDLVRVARAAGSVTAVTMHDYFTALASPIRRAEQTEPSAPPVQSFVSVDEVAEAFAFHRKDMRADVCAAQIRCAPSQSHAAGLAEMADGPLGGIEVTPPPLLETPVRRAGGDGPRGRRLATWGSIYPEKGLEVVLDALRLAGGGWSLEVWGDAHDPSYRESIMRGAAGLPVEFRGAFAAADLQALDADYAVLPSLCHESYGLVMDEALSLGLPVIASDLAAYRERASLESCVFFRAGDVHALEALLRDETRLSELLSPTPPEIATADAVAAQLVDLYERARRGEYVAAPELAIAESERVEQLFRRAERRLWTAVQQADPVAPPEGFLGPTR